MLHDAFISYSHSSDGRIAPALQSALHHFAKPWWRRRAISVFRDETNLAVHPDLFGTITEKLSQSGYFILLASPGAAKSAWVGREVAYWRRHREPDRLLIVLTEGEIAWDSNAGDFNWNKTDALPEELKGAFSREPLFLDIRWTRDAESFSDRDPRFLDTVARLSATLRGMSLDDISGEEIKQHRRTRRTAIAAVSAIALFAGGAGTGAWIAVRNAEKADHQSRVAISERNRVLRNQSLYLAGQANQATNTGNAETGALLAIAALPTRFPKYDRPYSQAAKQALYNALLGMRADKTTKYKGSKIISIDIDEENKRIITIHDEDTAVLWNLNNLSIIKKIRHKTEYGKFFFNFGIFDQSGKYFIVAGPSGGRLYRSSDGKYLRSFPVKGNFGLFVTTSSRTWNPFRFDSKGELFAGKVAGGKIISVWDTRTGSRISTMTGHVGSIASLAFSPDGRKILTGSEDKTARIWTIRTGDLFRVLEGHDGRVLATSISPNGKVAATGSSDKTVRLWDVDTGRLRHVLEGHRRSIFGLRFSDNGRRLLSLSYDNTVRIWNVANGKSVAVLAGHRAPVNWATFYPSSTGIITASQDGSVRLWRIGNKIQYQTLRGNGEPLIDAELNRSRNQLVTATNSHTITTWNLEGKFSKTVTRLEAGSVIMSVRFGRNGQFAIHTMGGRIHTGFIGEKRVRTRMYLHNQALTYGPKAGRTIALLQGRSKILAANRANEGEFSSDGKLLLTATRYGQVVVWDARTGKFIRELVGNDDQIAHASFNQDGSKVIGASEGGTAIIWSAGTGKRIATLVGHDARVNHARISSDGRYAVTASDDKTAIVWDLVSRKPIARLRGHAKKVRSAIFGPDTFSVVTTSEDGTAKIWDWRKQKLVATLSGHKGWVIGAKFSPSKRYLATMGTRVRIWRTGSWTPVVSIGNNGPFTDVLFHRGETEVTTVKLDSPPGKVSHLSYFIAEFKRWTFFDSTKKLIDTVKALLRSMRPGGLTPAEKRRYYLAE